MISFNKVKEVSENLKGVVSWNLSGTSVRYKVNGKKSFFKKELCRLVIEFKFGPVQLRRTKVEID